jgi:signal transduction histidine kinase/DNA-binding response OmpR family regulator/ligand-binding sensor domain-containing protein
MSSALLLSVFLTFSSGGDTLAPLPYQHIGKKDGLSNSAITSIYMDQYDYVWFGSWDGLNRYDGSTIKVYKPEAFGKGTLSNNIVRSVLEDKRGNLWIVTHKGINKYNRHTDSFTSYLSDLTNIPVLENSMRACLGSDSALWVSVMGQGINRYDAATDTFTPVTVTDVPTEWLKEVAGMGSANGLVYMLGNDGKLICLLNHKIVFSKQVVPAAQLRLHYFFQLQSKHYLALSFDDGRIIIHSLSDVEQQPQALKLSDFPVTSISVNRTNTALWIGTDLGDVFKLSLTQNKFIAVNQASSFPLLSKAQRKILSITETKQDMLWVGTDGDGIFKFLTRPKPFYSIPSGTTDKGGISNTIVRSVYEDTDGTVYVGTRGGGLNIVKPNKPTHVLNTARGLSNNAVLSLTKDKNNNIWIGVDGEGIDMLEARTGKILHFPRDFENKTDLTFNYVYAICEDAYGTIWLGTSGNGVINLKISKAASGKYRLDGYKKISHTSDDNTTSINSNVVYAIVEETPNILWFGTRGAGVYRYNSLSGKIEDHFFTGSPEKQRLSNDDVLSLFVSNKEELWIGTSGGINRISLQGKPFTVTHFTQREGLPNNTIHAILQDGNNTIWLSTNNGLVLYDPTKNLFKNFDTNDGLQNNEFTDGASFRSAISEKLFFGGINGLDIIYPSKLDTLSLFPRLTITQFQIHNVMITPSDSSQVLRQHIDLANDISLNYDQNFISFHFTTLNYWNKQRTEYKYFLENFDKDWNFIGQQSVVNLTNIPPGNYTLHINYTDENGIWNTHPKTIAIQVHPPFWKTTWAYLIYAVLLIGLQFGIVLIIRQRARTKRADAINKFKIQQMKELNDYKLQFFTNVAHEFRTPLTLIFGPVTALIKKATSAWERYQLKTIYGNSLRLQKLIEELIQFRKIESGKEKIEVAQVDLVLFTQDIVETFHQHAIDHEVNLEFLPEPETLQAYIDPKKLEKILINLISNAIKYNVKGGHVEVILHEKNAHALFMIKDTGLGIADRDRNRIFENFYQRSSAQHDQHTFASSTGIGLSLTKSLVELHQGEISVASVQGKGSTFTVTLPIEESAYRAHRHDKTHTLPVTNLEEKVQQEFSYINHTPDSPTPVLQSVTEAALYSVLIVDDHDQIVVLLQSILADTYKIFTARNGHEALALLDEEKIDLVISDIIMPEMDGLTLCRHIKDNIQTSHIPVILLTAKAEIEDRIEGLQMGADSYIPKPFHPDHLFIRIEKLIKSREQIKKRFENFADVELEKISTGISEKDDEFFVRITQCIEKHLSESEFTADTIADEVGMSKASLYKKVKATMGLTPHGLIKQYRLRKAADLLKNTDMSVSEVIYETGFNSRSYFYKSFNEMFHCHPKDFGGAKAG